jgi:hypothetical protein
MVFSCRLWTMQKFMLLDIYKKKCQKHKILGIGRTIDCSLDKINPSVRWILLWKNKAYTELCSRRCKVKVTPEQAMGAQRGARSAAVPIQNLGARMGWGTGQRHAPAALLQESNSLHRRLGDPRGRFGRMWKNMFFTSFQTSDRPVRSESLYGLRHSGRLLWRLLWRRLLNDFFSFFAHFIRFLMYVAFSSHICGFSLQWLHIDTSLCIKFMVFWYMTPCLSLECYRTFGGTFCLHLVQNISSWTTMKMEKARYFEDGVSDTNNKGFVLQMNI